MDSSHGRSSISRLLGRGLPRQGWARGGGDLPNPEAGHASTAVEDRDATSGATAAAGRPGESQPTATVPWHTRQRRLLRRVLGTKQKHYFVMAMVVADVSVILADIFVSLIACDTGLEAAWVGQLREAMKIIGLAFSCLFVLELLLSIWAYGIRFFHSMFHCFDALVIVTSLVVESLMHGVLEEIASIVVVLRLLRFIKIVDEISVGASDMLEQTNAKVEALERENWELKRRLGLAEP